MEGRILTLPERESLAPGEALTLTAVLAVLAVAIVTVVVFRLFRSQEGNVKLPGGWAFTWE